MKISDWILSQPILQKLDKIESPKGSFYTGFSVKRESVRTGTLTFLEITPNPNGTPISEPHTLKYTSSPEDRLALWFSSLDEEPKGSLPR
jgi:hypothetical protein